MTMILPVGMTIMGAAIGGPVGGASGAALGAGIGLVIGSVSSERGGGEHIRGNAKALLQGYMYTAMAANWGIVPVLRQYSEANQAVLLDDMYTATVKEPVEGILQQWTPIKAHVMRAHRSGIPPQKAMRWIRSNYRDRIIGKKQRSHAVAIATTVAQCYASAHSQMEADYGWYERWAEAIGFKKAEARSIWDGVVAQYAEAEAQVMAERQADVVIENVAPAPVEADGVQGATVAPAPAVPPRTLWDLD